MGATAVAQRKRTKGWRKPEGAVCVSRPSRWGNPFPLGGELPEIIAAVIGDGPVDRLQAVWLFDFWVRLSNDPRAVWIRDHAHELRGKTLLCWCDGPPCHAYVLADLADASVSGPGATT